MSSREGRTDRKLEKKAFRQYDLQVRALEVKGHRTTLEITSDQGFSFFTTLLSVLYFTWKQSRINKISFQAIHEFQKTRPIHPVFKFLLGVVARVGFHNHTDVREDYVGLQ